MNQELVSVIMPAYNAEKYIGMSIASVMRQTYGNVQLVVVDDGSVDNTENIIKEAALQCPSKIKFSVRQKNGGTAVALNDAIELAEGEYICWLSADDLYRDDMVESQVNFLKEHSMYDAVFSRCAYIDENDKVLSILEYNKDFENKMEQGMACIVSRLLCGNFWHGCSVLAKKECFKRKDRFNVEYRASQDYDFWIRMAADYNIGYLNKVNVLSRIHSEQGSKKMNCNLDEIKVFFHILRREDVMKKLMGKMELAYTLGNISPFIQCRVDRYSGMEDEMNVLKNEMAEYVDCIKYGQINFENESV